MRSNRSATRRDDFCHHRRSLLHDERIHRILAALYRQDHGDHPGHRWSSTPLVDIGLLILRIGIGAAIIQAGSIKALDFGTTVGFMESGGWSLPTFPALMVTVAETAGGVGLVLGVLTPLAACSVIGAMMCAWAVNVSEGAFWSQPFNVPFLLF